MFFLSSSLPTAMENLTVRPLEKRDIDFAYKMTMTEQWNVTRANVERMFSYEPNGCFIAEVDRSRAGHVFTVNYGKLGWIGLLIVKTQYRNRGIATLLTRKAINYLVSRGVETVDLDAVPDIADLYRKLGFHDEYDSLRFNRRSKQPAPVQGYGITRLEKERIGEIAEFDAAYFGGDRTRVLMSLYQENVDICFASYTGSKVVGYAMCRRAETGYNIGPLVCNTAEPQTARDLIAKCVKMLGSDSAIHLGVPAVNGAAVEIVQEFGFEQSRRSIRMRLGKNLTTERPDGIFAIGGAMKG